MESIVHHQIRDFDAIVIGAGFGGIYMLHKLRNEQGLTSARSRRAAASAAPGTSTGTPGAKSDTEGFVYRYSFDKELLQE